MIRIPVVVAAVLALAPDFAHAQVVITIDGVRQEVPAGVVRTVTTERCRTRVVDAPWSGAATPGMASVTTTETVDEDDRGRVLARTVVTTITPQQVAYAPVSVVVAPAPGYAPMPEQLTPAAEREVPETVVATVGAPRTLRLRREGWSGHFVAPVTINGVRLKAIIDTGAAYTILSPEDAARAGVIPDAEEVAVGIGGYTRVGVARLRSLEIGGRDLGRIRARIGRQGIPYTLLGQTEIARLGRVTIEDGTMVIEPRQQLASR